MDIPLSANDIEDGSVWPVRCSPAPRLWSAKRYSVRPWRQWQVDPALCLSHGSVGFLRSRRCMSLLKARLGIEGLTMELNEVTRAQRDSRPKRRRNPRPDRFSQLAQNRRFRVTRCPACMPGSGDVPCWVAAKRSMCQAADGKPALS